MVFSYFKVGVGKFIQYDDVTSRVTIIFKDNLLKLKEDLVARIDCGDPLQPKNKDEWVAWGKTNYPFMDFSAEQEELDKVNAVIEAIKGL
jgi:hypothetical protein